MEKQPKISEAEWAVMQILWQKSPVTSSYIMEELSRTKDWSPTTVQTLLSRLVNKKVVSYEKISRVHHYYPLITEKDCLKVERQSFLKRLYNGSLSSMLAGFLEDEELSEAELTELQNMLERRRE